MQNVVCARISVSRPKGTPSSEKNVMNASPTATSGSMMGSTATFCSAPLPLKRALASPTAPSVPSTAESAQLTSATVRLLTSASAMARFSNSARYHSVVKPVHKTPFFD